MHEKWLSSLSWPHLAAMATATACHSLEEFKLKHFTNKSRNASLCALHISHQPFIQSASNVASVLLGDKGILVSFSAIFVGFYPVAPFQSGNFWESLYYKNLNVVGLQFGYVAIKWAVLKGIIVTFVTWIVFILFFPVDYHGLTSLPS